MSLPIYHLIHLLLNWGEWQHSASLEKLELINPSDGSILTEIASGNENDIDAAITSAICIRPVGVQHLRLSVANFDNWQGLFSKI